MKDLSTLVRGELRAAPARASSGGSGGDGEEVT